MKRKGLIVMDKKPSFERSYNTNLAAEYYVLSILYRKGVEAYLTIGNKKSVDIIVKSKDGKIVTIDVKGLVEPTSWPIENVKPKPDHYIAFVSFNKKIRDENSLPEVFIVPSVDIIDERLKLVYTNPKGSRRVVQYVRLKRYKDKYLNNWAVFYQQEIGS